MNVHVSRHASERWLERVGPSCKTTWNARHAIIRAYHKALKLPYRYAHEAWSTRSCCGTSLRKRGASYLFTPRAILCMSGGTVVTVIPITDEELATVLWWGVTGRWFAPETTQEDRVRETALTHARTKDAEQKRTSRRPPPQKAAHHSNRRYGTGPGKRKKRKDKGPRNR